MKFSPVGQTINSYFQVSENPLCILSILFEADEPHLFTYSADKCLDRVKYFFQTYILQDRHG